MTVATGVPTAATDVSARTKLCVTPSLEPVSAVPDTEDGVVRKCVRWAPMVMDVSRSASAKMGLLVTT